MWGLDYFECPLQREGQYITVDKCDPGCMIQDQCEECKSHAGMTCIPSKFVIRNNDIIKGGGNDL